MNGKRETVATFNDLTQAQAAHAVLKAEGIAGELKDEMTGSIDWGLMPALGGLRLQVDTADVQRALDVLKDFDTETKNPAPLPAEDPNEPSGAEELAYQERSRRRKRLVVLVSFLILFLPVLLALFLGWLVEF